jgi:hypothetical protein
MSTRMTAFTRWEWDSVSNFCYKVAFVDEDSSIGNGSHISSELETAIYETNPEHCIIYWDLFFGLWTREEPSLQTLWLKNITMDKVQIIDRSNTAPSSKKFRDNNIISLLFRDIFFSLQESHSIDNNSYYCYYLLLLILTLLLLLILLLLLFRLLLLLLLLFFPVALQSFRTLTASYIGGPLNYLDIW